MHCKACDSPLRPIDLFLLPNGEENDLCSSCLQSVKEAIYGVPESLENMVYEIKTFVYNESTEEAKVFNDEPSSSE